MRSFAAVEAFRGAENLIRVVGHRGARGILPENSMIGFEFALETGAHLLEFDVVLTGDEIPVITHNHHLHAPTFRGADGQFLTSEPRIRTLTCAEIQRYEIGRLDGASAYGQRFPDQAQLDGVTVPRLAELLNLVSQPQHSAAYLMLELKSDPDLAGDAAHRQRLVDIIIQEVRTTGLTNRVLLHSFDWNLLAECQRQAPDIPASYLTQLPENADDVGEASSKAISPDFTGQESRIPDLVSEAGGRLWCPHVNDVSKQSVQRARELGLCVAVWTVNTSADINRMIDFGVDAIVSDYPGRVQRILSDRGLYWLDAGDASRPGAKEKDQKKMPLAAQQ